MKAAICVLFLSAQIAFAGLQKYSALVVADANANSRAADDSIRVTYLGVNGYQFETGDHVLLVDPYFSRIGLWTAALNRKIDINQNRVSEGLKHVRPRADAILATHAHFDHLLDAPAIMQRTGAKLFSGPTAINLVQSLGVSREKTKIIKPGDEREIGPWTIRVLAAQHDRLFGKVPFSNQPRPSPQSSQRSAPSRSQGSRAATGEGESRPQKVSDWSVGEPLAFVIEAAGKKIYVDSGGVPGAAPDLKLRHLDLAILGVALPDSRARFAEVVRQLRPRFILPSHQDDMFAPFERGFVFGKLTNFPELLRVHRKEKLPGRIVLLDYFRPWTLP